MASSAASSTNALLALNNQRPTENDQVPIVDAGGPRNDGAPIKTGSTADYADFKFDAAIGISPDSTLLPKAGVPAQPAESLASTNESDVEVEDEPKKEAPLEEEIGANAPDPSAEDVTDGEKLVKEDDSEDEDDLAGIDLDELAGDDVDLIDLPESDDLEDDDDVESDGDEDESDSDDSKSDDKKDDDDDKPLFASESHARTVYQKLKKLFEAEDQTVGKRDDDKETVPTGNDPASVAEGLFDDEDDEELPEVSEESDPLTTQSDAVKDPNAPTGNTNDEVALGESRKPKKITETKKFKLKLKFNEGKKLFEGNTILAEDDIRQSRALFESAVRTVAVDIAKQIRGAYQERYVASKRNLEEQATKRIDAYLSYVVEQWVADNKVALRSQLRAKLSENFVRGLKKLFVENYVEVPKSKVNVVTALARNVKSLKAQLSESESKAVKLHTELKETAGRSNKALVKEHKARLIAEAAAVLPASERGQFKERAATLKFESTKTFHKDLVALREQYTSADKAGKERPLAVPNAAPLFEQRETTPVDNYVAAIGKLTR
jgi:hypothetical protein